MVAIVGAVASAILAGIAWFCRRLLRKWRSFWERFETLEERADKAKRRNDKVLSILFGREVDESDDGLAEEVQSGFGELAQEIDELDGDLDDLDGVVSIIVVELHQDDDVDFDKNDYDFSAELKKLE